MSVGWRWLRSKSAGVGEKRLWLTGLGMGINALISASKNGVFVAPLLTVASLRALICGAFVALARGGGAFVMRGCRQPVSREHSIYNVQCTRTERRTIVNARNTFNYNNNWKKRSWGAISARRVQRRPLHACYVFVGDGVLFSIDFFLC